MTATATRTRKAATVTAEAPATRRAPAPATVTHGPDGTVLTGTRMMLPNGMGTLSLQLNRSRNPEALGWTWDKPAKAWIMDGSAGQASADMARVAELQALYQRAGLPLDVKLTRAGKVTTRATRATGESAPAPDAPAAPAPMAGGSDALAATLAAANVDPAVIAAVLAAVAAQQAPAPAPVKGTRATGERKPAGKAAGKPAAKPASAVTTRQGARVYTLPAGTRLSAAALAVRQAIAADVRKGGTCAGGVWHVRKDRAERTLSVECEGQTVSASIDAIVTGAIA